MASFGNPRTWIPYMNNKDCTQGFCSLYCPQWCYIVYPPPPPFDYPDDDSSPKFSPLVIAIIGVLATAFLLVSYYTIISKYCGPRESARGDNSPDSNDELREIHNLSTTGLDDVLIKSITVFKYKKEDVNFAGKVTDCSVCLSEFQDGDSVRLLPKCSHAFHAPCIDTWLKSNSTCPLCRSSIFNLNGSLLQVPVIPVLNIELPSTSSSENVGVEIGSQSEIDANHAMRAFSDLEGRHRVIEIRDEACYDSVRSVSMDHSIQGGFSVADVLHMNEEEDSQAEGCSNEAGSSKRSQCNKSRYRRKVLHCVLSPIAMKRSFSSGRFSFGKSDTGRQGIFPV